MPDQIPTDDDEWRHYVLTRLERIEVLLNQILDLIQRVSGQPYRGP
jgi:hypothetical protein